MILTFRVIWQTLIQNPSMAECANDNLNIYEILVYL
jgi:hypothetical protein